MQLDLALQPSTVPDSPATPDAIHDLDFREVDLFPAYASVRDGELFAISLAERTHGLTHGLHRFPAKFVPHIPRWALHEFARPGDVVLDPFAGSGTTLVEALLHPVHAVGLDVDPLARLIAGAKVAAISGSRAREIGRALCAAWTQPAARVTAPMPDVKRFEHWFRPETSAEIQALLDALDAAALPEYERRFCWAVVSSVLRKTSNADDQSQKTYVSGTLPKSPPPFRTTFWRAFERAAERLDELARARHPDATSAVPEGGDALRTGLPSASVDLAVTSPPYLDSVDYPYNMMAEYFWLGPRLGVPTRAAFNRMRRTPVGAKQPGEAAPGLSDDLARIVHADAIPEPRRPAAAAYFDGMARHLGEMARVLKPGGRYVLVIGNSQTALGIVPVHDGLVRLAADAGLRLDKAFAYRIRRHHMKFPRKGRGGIILIDWVLVFERQPGDGPAPHAAPLPLPWATLGDDDVAN